MQPLRPPLVRKVPWVVLVYGTVTLLCLVASALATVRMQTLNSSAGFLESRLHTQAQDYAATLQGRYMDDEMASLQERRALLTSSAGWWQLRLGCLMAWVLASFAFYLQRSVVTLTEEITDP